uniref:Elongator complex protein 5 n=1 Tax=Arion vulgaris TaxID=1028688 RepID=A0A0B7B246_9EUPU
MLEDLLKGAEKSRLILVTDETECPGRHLLLNWIHNLGNRCDKIILICFERHTDFFTNWLPVNLQNKIIAIDYRSSNLGRDTDAILDKAISMTSQVGETVAVVIDSLSLHITLKSAAGTCHLLHKLASGSSVAQVVALLHRDVHDRSTCSLIEHIASSVIDIVSSTRFKYTCCIRHCRSTGKVYKSREYFVTDDNFHIENFGSASPGDSSTSQKQVSKVCIFVTFRI